MGCLVIANLIPRLSRKSCVRLAGVLGLIAYYLDRRGRRVARSNLECVFGERYTPAERERIIRESYKNFSRTMLDLFWTPCLTRENYQQWIKLEGSPEAVELVARGRGVAFLTGHFGNWEWSNICAGYLNPPMTVAENFKNPRLTRIFNAMREHSGSILIPQENSLMRMLKRVKKGEPTALVFDLNIPPSQASTIVTAFRNPDRGFEGLKMCVPVLPAVLGQRGPARLVIGEAIPQPDGSCRIFAEASVQIEETDTFQMIAQKCWDAFEPVVLRNPQYYLWAYKHFRYKPKGALVKYPLYANENGKFEKMLKAQGR